MSQSETPNSSSSLSQRPAPSSRRKEQALRSYEKSLPIALLRAREALMTSFRPMVQEHGVTEQQWRVIRALAEQDKLDATQLAEKCCILMPSLSRILKVLEERRLVKRMKEREDGRRISLSLTQKGRALYVKITPRSEEIYAHIEQCYGPEQINLLLKLLNELIDLPPFAKDEDIKE